MNAIILLLSVYIAVGDGQGSDYDQELENILTKTEEREGFFNSIQSFVMNTVGLSEPETTPINTMTKGISKADCEIQLKDYCDKLQLECLNADVVYIYGSQKNAGNCFLHFEEELHGLQATNIKQVMKEVEKTELSSNSKMKYLSMALDRKVVLLATQTDATWGLSRIGDVKRKTKKWDGEYSFDHENYGTGVRVFVMDTGIDEEWVKKEEFAGRVEAGADFTDEGVGVKDTDRFGHGTHCSGTVLGKKYGVAKNATLVPVKAFNKDGVGYASWLRRAMEWIQKQCEEGAPCVVSASWGSGHSTTINSVQNTVHNTPVDNLVDSGVVFVTAAGNDYGDACNDWPASSEKVITVGSVDWKLKKSDFSNYGKCVDIWAPGERVFSTVRHGKVHFKGGTSMATPHVSGVVAAYISQSGERDPTIIKQKLLRNAAEGVTKNTKSANSGFVQLIKYTPLIGEHMGCYKDKKDPRAFSHRHSQNRLSLESCSTYCQDRGSQYMGYGNGKKCYCSEPNDNVFRYSKVSKCKDGKGGRSSLNIYDVHTILHG